MSELCERSWETPRLLVSTGEDLGYVERQSENGKIRVLKHDEDGLSGARPGRVEGYVEGLTEVHFHAREVVGEQMEIERREWFHGPESDSASRKYCAVFKRAGEEFPAVEPSSSLTDFKAERGLEDGSADYVDVLVGVEVSEGFEDPQRVIPVPSVVRLQLLNSGLDIRAHKSNLVESTPPGGLPGSVVDAGVVAFVQEDGELNSFAFGRRTGLGQEVSKMVERGPKVVEKFADPQRPLRAGLLLDRRTEDPFDSRLRAVIPRLFLGDRVVRLTFKEVPNVFLQDCKVFIRPRHLGNPAESHGIIGSRRVSHGRTVEANDAEGRGDPCAHPPAGDERSPQGIETKAEGLNYRPTEEVASGSDLAQLCWKLARASTN